MKRILALLCAAVVFVGCASSHVSPSAPAAAPVSAPAIHVAAAPAVAPVVSTVNTNVAVERAALDAAIAPTAPVKSPSVTTSALTPAASSPVVATPAPAASVVSAPSSVATEAKQSITKTAVAAKSHKAITVVIVLIVLGAAAYFTRKYWLPLWQKLLAWLKKQRVVSDLENLAAEAKTKIIVDFKDEAAKIDADIQGAPAAAPLPAKQVVAAPVVHPVTTTPPTHESSAAAAFAKAEHKS